MEKVFTKFSKKTISIFLSLLILCSAFAFIPDIPAKAEERVAVDTEIYCNDYNSVVASTDTVWGGYAALSNNLYPLYDSDNGYLYYRQNTMGLGVIRLGHNYDNKSVTGYDYIKAVPGRSYRIEFDMFAAPYLNTTQYPQWPVSDLKIGVAVSNPTKNYHEGSYLTASNYLAISNTSYYQYFDELTIKKHSLRNDTEWSHQSIVFTIPENCDVSKNNALQIFLTEGQRCGVSIDNIKVYELAGVNVKYVIDGNETEVFYSDGIIPEALPSGIAPNDSEGNVLNLYKNISCTEPFKVSEYVRTGVYSTVYIYGKYEPFRYSQDTVLFTSGYDTAAKQNFDSSSGQPWLSNAWLNAGGEICATTDPENSSNTVLHYSHYRMGYGMLMLGDGYTDENVTDSITVKSGVSYKISFKYKAKGTVGSNATVGIALYQGNTKDFANYSQFTNAIYLPQSELYFNSGLEYDTGWKEYTVYYTIPNNADLSVNNKIGIYSILGNSKLHLYFDDITITALAGVDVTYQTSDEQVTVFYSDGIIPDTIPEGITKENTDGQPVAFYTDSEYTAKFNAAEYIRTGVYSAITLYGRYETFSYDNDTVLFQSDYEGAYEQKIEEGAVEPWSQFFNSSGDLYPFEDPDDPNNTVIRYSHYRGGLGTIVLGDDYADTAVEDYITVKKGVTYKISFKWRATGAPKNSQAYLGIAVGNEETAKNSLAKFYENVSQYTEEITFDAGVEYNTQWATYTTYFTVKNDTDLSVSNKLFIYVLRGDNRALKVYFDDVSVVALANRTYTVKFNTNGGNAMSDIKTNLEGLNELPSATRNAAVFMGWYTDIALKNAFDVNDYIDTTAPIQLYAKWHIFSNGAVITMDNLGFWKEKNGSLSGGRLNYSFTPETENGNNVMKYEALYAASQEDQVEIRGLCKLPAAQTYPARMTLYNPDKTAAGNYDWNDVTYRAEVGKTYRITFKYKVTSVDTEHSDMGMAFHTLTGNIRNSHDNWVIHSKRFLVENSTTGWKTASTYFTVKELGADKTENGITYFSDAIMLGVTGWGTVLIDDVSVTDWDIETATYVSFATKGGEEIPSQEYILKAGVTLPKAVRKGYEFDCWYEDSSCTKKFNPANYKRTDGLLTLYAGYKGMEGVTEIDFETPGYYLSGAGVLGHSRLATTNTLEKDGNNTYVKYKYTYSEKKIEVENNCQGQSGSYGQIIGLYDPSKLLNANWTYEDAAYSVKEGEKYFISWDYKIISCDTESDYPSAFMFHIGASRENSCHDGRQAYVKRTCPDDEVSGEWKTASCYFTVPKINKDCGTRMALYVIGYGEIWIDNITIVKLENAVVYDTDGGTVIRPKNAAVGSNVILPADPVREGSKFLGWYTDANCTQAYTATKQEKGVKVLYAKFLTYQTIQDFEHYSLGMSEAFEHAYTLNRPTKVTPQAKYYKWTMGYDYMPDNVRNGKVSAMRRNDDQYTRYMSLIYMNDPLTVGEEYEISFWVKITDYFLPGELLLVHTDYFDSVSKKDGWVEGNRGKKEEKICSTKNIATYHHGEWVEIKYSFTARAKYVGIATPGITEMFIDDACITLKSADSTYIRSIEGAGVKFEDWYSEDVTEEKVEDHKIKVTFDEVTVDFGMSTWVWVAIIGGGVLVVAGACVATFLIIRKRKTKI